MSHSERPSSARPTFVPLKEADLRLGPTSIDWIWQGYLARGNVTLLTSQWKSGKTTLAATLLRRLGLGGELAGLPVTPGRAVIVTEEEKQHWGCRSAERPFGDHVTWFCEPFISRPRPHEWSALLDDLEAMHAQSGLDLVAVDPLASFFPGKTENDAGSVMDALLPLKRLTRRGIGVLLLHHPRKEDSPPGQAARGSGALCGFVDILIEMQWYKHYSDTDRRRRLRALSRHTATPRHHVIEWSADGSTYLSLGDASEFEYGQGWEVLRRILGNAARKLTRQEIVTEWPLDQARPDEVTLWRWLEKSVEQGRVLRDGKGRKGSPFRYWLKEQEKVWRQDPFHLPDLEELL